MADALDRALGAGARPRSITVDHGTEFTSRRARGLGVSAREWTVESIIGNLYSMSFCNRKLLGERTEAFERDLRSAILAVEASGTFRGEAHQFFALMAFKR